jgi:hypothetical protein
VDISHLIGPMPGRHTRKIIHFDVISIIEVFDGLIVFSLVIEKGERGPNEFILI